MGATVTEQPQEQAQDTQDNPESAQTQEQSQQPEQDATDWKAEARKWETRAKENAKKATEFEKARQASMTDADKAIAEAETRGRTAAVQEYGSRLVRTEFDASAARRNPDFKTSDVLEYVDLSRMLDEHGEPDSKAIQAAVKRLVPEPQGASGPVDLNGGSRTPATPTKGMSDVIRQAAGR